MERDEIIEIFEAFFEKYKKTEGDRTVWSAVWTDHTKAGRLDINLTKCPRGTVLKVYRESRKLAEVIGWDAFFEEIEKISEAHPGLYDEDRFFEGMREMV